VLPFETKVVDVFVHFFRAPFNEDEQPYMEPLQRENIVSLGERPGYGTKEEV
jgi:hypothetical protein